MPCFDVMHDALDLWMCIDGLIVISNRFLVIIVFLCFLFIVVMGLSWFWTHSYVSNFLVTIILLCFLFFVMMVILCFQPLPAYFQLLNCDVLVVILNPLLLSITNGHDGILWFWTTSSFVFAVLGHDVLLVILNLLHSIFNSRLVMMVILWFGTPSTFLLYLCNFLSWCSYYYFEPPLLTFSS